MYFSAALAGIVAISTYWSGNYYFCAFAASQAVTSIMMALVLGDLEKAERRINKALERIWDELNKKQNW
jgi:HEPN domain-containing protein